MSELSKPVHFPENRGKLYRALQHNRIVQRKDIVAFYGGDIPLANKNIQALLKSGKAVRIKTGVYYFKRPDEFYDNMVYVNPLLIAAKVYPDGAIVYHTALKVLGSAYSESQLFQVGVPNAVRRPPRSFEFQNAAYQFHRVDMSFGIDSTVVADVRIKCFSKERALLEGLVHPHLFFGMSEFLQSVEGFAWVNTNALLDMLPRYPVKTVGMRLGWLLERFRERWHVPAAVLASLEKHRTISRVFLLPDQRKDNRLESRWNLMVPKTLYNLDEA